MPNWCDNYITFTGNAEQISKLNYLITAPVKVIPSNSWLEKLSFDKPPWEYDEDFKSDLKPGGAVMSRTLGFLDKSAYDYDSMVRNLGTKWDFDLDISEVTDTKISGYGQTAWSPPEGWFRMVCSHYNLNGELSSGEGGSDFGCIIEIVDTEYRTYGSNYNNWACLNYDSIEEYRDMLLDMNEGYPKYIQNILNEFETWPKSLAEYKNRYRE